MTAARIALRGAGGEPVDLLRTLTSHGLATLPPSSVDEIGRTLAVTTDLGRGRVRTIVIAPAGRSSASVTVLGPRVTAAMTQSAVARARWLLRLDEDLSGFYADVTDDSDLAWAAAGAGRMLRSGSVFEEVVKTICTTNCSWGLTTKMIGALVANLGRRAPGVPSSGALGRAFPTPEAMAAASDEFYRDVMRAGYRGPYFRKLAALVAAGDVDLESFEAARSPDIPDDEIEQRLLALPGVGPYAAAHVMLMVGRYSRLILDSWTRPTYARLRGRKQVADATIVRRFKRYGPFAGLAFWLYLTHSWVEG